MVEKQKTNFLSYKIFSAQKMLAHRRGVDAESEIF